MSVHYYPILKGRLGELTAVRYMAGEVRGDYTPIFELMPTGNEIGDEGEVVEAEIGNTVTAFNKRLANIHNSNSPELAVDSSLLPRTHSIQALRTIFDFQQQEHRVEIVPVVRTSDDPTALEELGTAIGHLSGAIVRLAGDDLDDAEAPVEDAVQECISALGVAPEKVTVLVDLGASSSSDDLAFRARFARLVLSEVPENVGRVAFSSGAFPPDLNDVRPNDSRTFPRLDAELWNRVQERVSRNRPLDGYGDYAVANPIGGVGVPFAPAPQLRYTRDEDWLVVKGRKNERRSNLQFFDICAQIVALSDFDPELSWADREIAEKAVHAGAEDVPTDGITTGNAMMWRALGTNHHLSFVIRRLALLGAP